MSFFSFSQDICQIVHTHIHTVLFFFLLHKKDRDSAKRNHIYTLPSRRKSFFFLFVLSSSLLRFTSNLLNRLLLSFIHFPSSRAVPLPFHFQHSKKSLYQHTFFFIFHFVIFSFRAKVLSLKITIFFFHFSQSLASLCTLFP